MDVITSNKNDRIRNVSALQKSKKSRTEQRAFVAEGIRLAEDVFRSGAGLIREVYASESFAQSGELKRLYDLAGGTAVTEPVLVKDSVFGAMSETVTPQGILCVVEQPQYGIDDMIGDKKVKLLILEDIQDPGNLGTMIRTAEAAGMNGVIMSRGTVDIFSPKVIRSTMGAVLRVPFTYADDLNPVLDELRQKEIRNYAAYLRNGDNFKEVDYSDRAAIVIGNEGNGLSDGILEHCDRNVFIPMAGEVESLNAAVAAALLMYAL